MYFSCFCFFLFLGFTFIIPFILFISFCQSFLKYLCLAQSLLSSCLSLPSSVITGVCYPIFGFPIFNQMFSFLSFYLKCVYVEIFTAVLLSNALLPRQSTCFVPDFLLFLMIWMSIISFFLGILIQFIMILTLNKYGFQ